MPHRAWLRVAACFALCAFALPHTQVEARTPASRARSGKHAGFLLGGALSVGEANFDLEAANDDSDIGTGLVLDIGYGFENGLALTLDLSFLSYQYQTSFLGETVQYEINLTMVSPSLWYIFDLSQGWRGYARLGIGSTTAELDFFFREEQSSEGYFLAGGAHWYFNPEVALWLELFGRYYGVTFTSDDFEQEEIQVFGLNVGVLWL